MSGPAVLEALGHPSFDDFLQGPELDSVRTRMKTEFDLPLLPVRTDDGYDPPLDHIVDWVIDQTHR